ncbi:GNAT family N-acetyltransferase [Vibrio zhugei]|uniref:GNAT family N-acetyltransferase n=1 Tax=Vibrio zhugei TaxID=2479546 RepID=A0ABV7CEJ4_9VIBR|nr:GNAT family N-acetyltransferase [Vibrio zhugei]
METERLLLRQWTDHDKRPYVRLTSDLQVMRYFPAPLSRAQSDEQAEHIQTLIAKNGWGFWAVELKSTGEFIGFVGLHYQDQDSGLPHAPMFEIGWRLDARHWRQGYATEAAQRALWFAFEELKADKVYAFTAIQNVPSQAVMKKLGMINTHHDFDHPKLAQDHTLARHCLYHLSRERWQAINKRG